MFWIVWKYLEKNIKIKMTKEILVDKLLNYFLNENKTFQNYEVPNNYDDKRLFLRGIINLREPKPISEDILKLEDELLKQELEEIEVTDVKDIKEVENKISVWQGDITTLKIETIVNAGNSYLLGCFIPNHSCVDNIIHTKAGIRLRLTCNDIMKGREIETGKAIITKSYNLPSKYIIHTVGPIVQNPLTEKEIKELENCYISCLDLARKHSLKTIAFPCISSGLFHFPKDKASIIAVNTVRTYLKKYPNTFDKIIFNVFTREDKECYDRLFKN